MAFRVEIQPQAFADLDSMAVYIKDRSSFATTERWFNAIIKDIASVKEMPQPCSVAAESEDLDREVRVLLHGRRNRTYKIYFPCLPLAAETFNLNSEVSGIGLRPVLSYI